jgi:hypothetical protein
VIVIAVIALTIVLAALLVRGLRSIEPDEEGPGREPEWWPEFERDLADYVARRSGRPPVD